MDSTNMLPRDELRQLAMNIFRERKLTADEAGADYTVDQLTATVLAIRDEMLATIETLPEAAWEPRSSGEDETSWNAGQIILHLANAQSSLVAGVRQLVDQPAGDTTRYELTTDIAAMDAIGVFHDMTAEARELFASIPEDTDLTRTVETERLGSLGIKGWLLIMAIHEADHLGQLKSLSS